MVAESPHIGDLGKAILQDAFPHPSHRSSSPALSLRGNDEVAIIRLAGSLVTQAAREPGKNISRSRTGHEECCSTLALNASAAPFYQQAEKDEPETSHPLDQQNLLRRHRPACCQL